MIEQAQSERVAPVAGNGVRIVGKVAHHFVDAIDAQRGEMVAQGAQVTLGVGEQPLVHQSLDQLALDLQALAAQFQQAVQRGVQRSLVARVQITQARAVDGEIVNTPVEGLVATCGARHDACADDVVDQHRHGLGRMRVVAHQIAHPVAQKRPGDTDLGVGRRSGARQPSVRRPFAAPS